MAKVYKEDMFPNCPAFDFECPYYEEKTGKCIMFKEENVLPYEECDAFDEDDFEELVDLEMGFDPYMGDYTWDR